jgi:4-oxalomesaconate tautomerase
MSDGIPVIWMRGGTSKGGYFLAGDLPGDAGLRDAVLLRIMGSPDPRQIDGMGGADPLTSKVAVVRRSDRPGVDVDYLFLQVFVDRPVVTDAQNCGNILAGVGPFAIERGLVAATDGETVVRIWMENTGQMAEATVQTPRACVTYAGEARIDGVPGTAAPVGIVFSGTAGSSCGALLPTGRAVDLVAGVEATLIDNGMPCVILSAMDFGLTGGEAPADLDADTGLKARLEEIRLAAGPMMTLGDVAAKSVPKMVLVSPPAADGTIRTRTFIPHVCHKAIGVLGAVTVGTACLLPDGPAARVAAAGSGNPRRLDIEHPTGTFTALANLADDGSVDRVGVLSTARKLMEGVVHA